MAHEREAARSAAASPQLVPRHDIFSLGSGGSSAASLHETLRSGDASRSGRNASAGSAAASTASYASSATGRKHAGERNKRVGNASTSTSSTSSSAATTSSRRRALPSRANHSHSHHSSHSSQRQAPGDAGKRAAGKDAGPLADHAVTPPGSPMASPPPSPPGDNDSSSSSGQGSDREENAPAAANAPSCAGLSSPHPGPAKPSRMVVKRRATASPSSGGRRVAPSSQPPPPPQLSGMVSLQKTAPQSPQAATVSNDERSRKLQVLRSYSSKLSARSPTPESGDGSRDARHDSNSRNLHRQLLDSPTNSVGTAERRREHGSEWKELEREGERRQQPSSRAAGPSTPLRSARRATVDAVSSPSPSLKLLSEKQSTPRRTARKLVKANSAGDVGAVDSGGGSDKNGSKKRDTRPVRIRYEEPPRGMTGGKRDISHASLGKLVARLTDAHQYDTEFRDVFLLTFRCFCSPYDFIKKLVKRYNAVLSLCGDLDADTLRETQQLLDQIVEEELESDRSSTATSVSTARSDINTSMEANVSIMRLLSVLKYWIKESGFIDLDIANDRRTQRKLMAFLADIQSTSPVVSIRRHAESLLLTVAQLIRTQQYQQRVMGVSFLNPLTASASTNVFGRGGVPGIPPPPVLSTSTSASAIEHLVVDKASVTMGGHERGAELQALAAAAASKLHLARSSSDPKQKRSMVKLKTKASNGDIFQVRTRSGSGVNGALALGAGSGDVPSQSKQQRPSPATLTTAQSASPIVRGSDAVPRIARGVTTGSAGLDLSSSGVVGLEDVLQDSLQRSRTQTAAVRSSSRMGYDHIEPLAGLTAQEIADQLTLMEAEHYFARLNPRELTNKAWTRETKLRDAPHVVALIELFDATAEWVSSEILHPQLQALERAKLIALFIDVADNCYQMNNFNTMFEVVTGISAPCIRQLTTTWGLVSAAAQEKYQCLQQACSTEDNYRSYRQGFALAESLPRLPCWFILVKDLFTFEEAMKSMEDGLVHWHKFRRIARVIGEALDRQNFQYVPPSAAPAATGVSRKGKGMLRHDRKTQIHLRHRLDTVRKDSTVLYQLARNANTQESILFVNSLSEAGFL